MLNTSRIVREMKKKEKGERRKREEGERGRRRSVPGLDPGGGELVPEWRGREGWRWSFIPLFPDLSEISFRELGFWINPNPNGLSIMGPVHYLIILNSGPSPIKPVQRSSPEHGHVIYQTDQFLRPITMVPLILPQSASFSESKEFRVYQDTQEFNGWFLTRKVVSCVIGELIP